MQSRVFRDDSSPEVPQLSSTSIPNGIAINEEQIRAGMLRLKKTEQFNLYLISHVAVYFIKDITP